ncbi:peptide chain release factor 2 [Buchnera aphidicola (Nipponaphis monzeni)]|uniref:Peptide chain release factor 2 n=1 Tax=Buchnera aphidicola (Nipponaphis monzeni) TaxID=2495405 RepID=A0A455TAH7_9GAMM|nr:peptide chain release factor 2 [Buchnera aphidicola (Nipponaphis monzeni)]
MLQSFEILENTCLVKKLIKEKCQLNKLINSLNSIRQEINDISILVNLSSPKDTQLLHEAICEIIQINKKIKKIEFYKMFSHKNDHLNCYIDLKSGSGGIESQDWTKILTRMYLKWADKKKFKTKIIEQSVGELNGIKSTTIYMSGNYAFGWMRTETGIHRLVRKNPFSSDHKRHTSFTSVFVYPDTPKKNNVYIKTSDLRTDVYRSSGAGGQHVNRTESAVRITHIPSNIVTQCQNSRSQHKNKEQALKQMKIKLNQLATHKTNLKKKLLENTKCNIAWGHQIRSYILDNSRIKDIRTGLEVRNVQSVLNGHLDLFIKANLKNEK